MDKPGGSRDGFEQEENKLAKAKQIRKLMVRTIDDPVDLGALAKGSMSALLDARKAYGGGSFSDSSLQDP
jgi:hypothetical protein